MTSKNTVIGGKKYSVEFVFNLVGNYYFTDKNKVSYLVDNEDVAEWILAHGKKHKGLATAIAYAKEKAREEENGQFWWESELFVQQLGRFAYGDEIARFVNSI